MIVLLAVGLSAGCGAARKKAAVPAAAPSQAEPSARDAAVRAIPELAPVFFTYDSDALSREARAALARSAAWLKERPGVRVQVAGHCDERGTVEYNLALGQRRAAAVRTYYRHLGIEGGRVATISYGKERPACAGSGEECWSRNRRAETLELLYQNVGSAVQP